MFIGIDIGGTNIKAVIRQDNKIIKKTRKRTPKTSLEILGVVFDLIDNLIEDTNNYNQSAQKIGLAVAGLVDSNNGQIIQCPNLPDLDNLNLKKKIWDKFKIKTSIDNDANCFLLGEIKKKDLDKKYQNIIGITLGSGVGGGIWLGGQIYHGYNNVAAEFGWMIIREKDGRLLSFEDLCSKKWFLNNFQKEPEEIYQLARQNNQEALNVWQDYGENLGIGLANLTNIFDPDTIILGGGISQANKFFEQPMRDKIEQLVFSLAGKEVKIIIADDPSFSGAIGASWL